MSTENQVQLLMSWLESHPGELPPEGLEPEVVEAVYVLRPDLAPAPRIGIDDILARVESGPFASRATPEKRSRMSPIWIWGGGGLAAAAMALFVVLPMQGEVAEMPSVSEIMDAAALAPEPESDVALVTPPLTDNNREREEQHEEGTQALGRADANLVSELELLSDQAAKSGDYAVDFEGVDGLAPPNDIAVADSVMGELATALEETAPLGDLGSQGTGQGGGGFESSGLGSRSASTGGSSGYGSGSSSFGARRARTAVSASPPAPEAAPEASPESEGAVVYQERTNSMDWEEDDIDSASAQDCAGPSTPLVAPASSTEESEALATLREQIETLRAGRSPQAAAMLAADRIGDANANVAQEFALRAALLSLESGNLAMALGYLQQGKSRQAAGPYAMRLLSLEGMIYNMMGQPERAEESWQAACSLGE
jgi:hypothetical protein